MIGARPRRGGAGIGWSGSTARWRTSPPGETIVAQGRWRNDHRHGSQFTELGYRTTLPATTQVTRRYPGSGLVRSVGPMRAERIIATWEEKRHVTEVMTVLPGYGTPMALAIRICKRFENESSRAIAGEPYRLAQEVWDIGFRTAGTISRAPAGGGAPRLRRGGGRWPYAAAGG